LAYLYRKTAENFYRNSIPLLRRAIGNLRSGEVEPNPRTGRNYTLPSNVQALHFFYELAKRKLAWLLYGAFYEKNWNIAVYSDPTLKPLSLTTSLLNLDGALIPRIADQYLFYADPFFSVDGSRIYAEALDRSTGLGDIVVLDSRTGKLERVVLNGEHFSYPQAVEFDKSEYLLPEISQFSSPSFVKLSESSVPEYKPVVGLQSFRMVDVTYCKHENAHYLFASYSADSRDNLQLFVAESQFGPYAPHPLNPIVVDPTRARMAGAIVTEQGKLYRLGQNNAYGYGGRIALCEIQELSPTRYREKWLKEIGFEGNVFGPHTLNIHGDTVVVDYYREQFSALAGYRRLLGRLAKLTGKS
jgi:hypothetical protein